MVVFIGEGRYAVSRSNTDGYEMGTVAIGALTAASMLANMLTQSSLLTGWPDVGLDLRTKEDIFVYTGGLSIAGYLLFLTRFNFRTYIRTKYRNESIYEDKETGVELGEDAMIWTSPTGRK